MKLIALRPVLYQSRLYRAGAELPVNNAAMIEAWLQAGSAKWVDEATQSATATTTKPKARKAAAIPGIEGRSDSGTIEQGRIPRTPDRSRKGWK